MTGRWWMPSRHQDRRPGLLARNAVKAALRAHFEAEGFVEVEAAALQVSPGNETHLHAFATAAVSPDGRSWPLYLHTSPEFALKKVLAAGERKIFDFARVFRNRETGVRHAREFVMLEWYRAEEDYTVLMADCAAIVRLGAEAAGVKTLRHGGRLADPFAEPERLSVADAFRRHAGIDLLATLDPAGQPLREPLAGAAAGSGVRVADDDGWSDIFSRVMAERIEPRIGNGRVTILSDYPLPEAALARRKPGEPRVAERFEMFACGLELANAFGELRDAAEQRARFEADMDEKARLYGERYPIDEDFLAALPLMPEASGCALGFDRLVMLLLGVPRIEDIQWTPAAEPDPSSLPRRKPGSRLPLDSGFRRNDDFPGTVPCHLRSVADLVAAGLVAEDDRPALEAVTARYAVALTPEMAALVDPADADDPVGRQFLPSPRELEQTPEENPDPIADNPHSPVKGLVHRYPDRVLLKPLHTCPVYCRFCFRRESVGPNGAGTLSEAELAAAFAYVVAHPGIFELIVSGGDPFMLAPRRMGKIAEAAARIPHLRVMRWHSRVPLVDPGRVGADLVAAARSFPGAVYIAIHANHPREFTPRGEAALARLADAGIVLVSQSVLLKGVNDRPEVLEELMRTFVVNRVKPYYLHHGDLAPGTAHFRTTIAEGQALMRTLRGRLSGIAQPTYVVDLPGGHGKVPVGPNYVGEEGIEDPNGAWHAYPAGEEG